VLPSIFDLGYQVIISDYHYVLSHREALIEECFYNAIRVQPLQNRDPITAKPLSRSAFITPEAMLSAKQKKPSPFFTGNSIVRL